MLSRMDRALLTAARDEIQRLHDAYLGAAARYSDALDTLNDVLNDPEEQEAASDAAPDLPTDPLPPALVEPPEPVENGPVAPKARVDSGWDAQVLAALRACGPDGAETLTVLSSLLNVKFQQIRWPLLRLQDAGLAVAVGRHWYAAEHAPAAAATPRAPQQRREIDTADPQVPAGTARGPVSRPRPALVALDAVRLVEMLETSTDDDGMGVSDIVDALPRVVKLALPSPAAAVAQMLEQLRVDGRVTKRRGRWTAGAER